MLWDILWKEIEEMNRTDGKMVRKGKNEKVLKKSVEKKERKSWEKNQQGRKNKTESY